MPLSNSCKSVQTAGRGPALVVRALSQGGRGLSCADPLSRRQVPQAREKGCGSRDWPLQRGKQICMPSEGCLPECTLCPELTSGSGWGPGPEEIRALVPVLPQIPFCFISVFPLTQYVHRSNLCRVPPQPCGVGP